jgi:hypothetical protein
MFPHLISRLFCAKTSGVMRRGLATMNFTFFIIQLSSMITGGRGAGAGGVVGRPGGQGA